MLKRMKLIQPIRLASLNSIWNDFGGGFSCLKDRMLEKFQPIKIAKRFHWLNAFLTKSKPILTENVLNQWKIIKNITNCGLQPQYYSDNHQN